MNLNSQLMATMTTIEKHLRQLQTQLQQAKTIQAQTFHIPHTEEGLEGEPVREPITVHQQTRATALNHISNHLLDFYAHEGESTRIIRKLPGVLQLYSPDPGGLINNVAIINQQKNQFQQLVKQLAPKAETRHELLHHLFYQLITLNVYRQLYLFEEPVKSVGFYWGKKPLLYRTTQKEVLKRLENTQIYGSPYTLDQESFKEQVAKEIEQISLLPRQSNLVYRRYARIAPSANITYEDGQRRPYPAHTPYLFLASTPHAQPVKVGPLKTYEPHEIPVPRRYKPLIARLHLYLEE